MREWIDLGSSPPDETCAQVGSENYRSCAQRECTAYIHLLRRVLGDEPEGARLAVHANPHDFGTYLSVVCHYDPEIPESLNYAFRCESDGPSEWDDEARRELARERSSHVRENLD